jgi:hypothetical protein
MPAISPEALRGMQFILGCYTVGIGLVAIKYLIGFSELERRSTSFLDHIGKLLFGPLAYGGAFGLLAIMAAAVWPDVPLLQWAARTIYQIGGFVFTTIVRPLLEGQIPQQ